MPKGKGALAARKYKMSKYKVHSSWLAVFGVLQLSRLCPQRAHVWLVFCRLALLLCHLSAFCFLLPAS